MNSDQVRYILLQYRSLLSLVETNAALHPYGTTGAILRQKVCVIESWFSLLTEAEMFVVRKHLFDKYAWPVVVEAYEELVGMKEGRDERTLKRYQKAATTKIARFIAASGYDPQIAALFQRELLQMASQPRSEPILTLLEGRKLS